MSVTARFARSIYRAPALQETAAEFAELTEIEMQETDDAFEVVLAPNDGVDSIDLVRHFANFALASSLAAYAEDGP